MSNLFGGTFESNRDDGDSLFDAGAWGEARLAYERAMKKGGDTPGDQLEAVKEREAECRLMLAKVRIEEADSLADSGELEEARSLLEDAVDICKAAEVAEMIADRRTRYEAEAARQLAGEEEEMTEEELLAILAGTWIDSQAEEYASLPDEFRTALLMGHDGDHEGAAELIASVIEGEAAPLSPRYAHLELGKELVAAQRLEEAIGALNTFVELTEDEDEAEELIMGALTILGTVLLQLDRTDEADEALVRATRISTDNHVAFLNLGIFLRNRGELDRSLTALERAVELMGQMRPDFRVVREIAFTYMAMGRKEEAEKNLYAVIEHQASQGNHDQFDPEAAVPLARLYEKKGEIDMAADLFRHLAVGYDTANHYTYNLEAARLLKLRGGDPDLISRYSARAEELASDEDQKAAARAMTVAAE